METTERVREVLDFRVVPPRYLVIANLPKNSAPLAVQAEQAGVDAVMLNIEGEEGGYPGHFGSYELHEANINDVVSVLAIPCGIFIGGAKPPTPKYWESIVSKEFSFVDMYAHQMPLFAQTDKRVRKILAISSGYILEQVRALSEMDGTDAIEVAIVPPKARGDPLTALDFATLKLITELSTKPILLRAQKKIVPLEISSVIDLGVRGLVIDPCILSGAEEAYRDEIAGFQRRREVAE